ncbi:formate dehydrogenase accessory sulfurtransferase FdhD [Dokdonella sp.]|uniref:formate dehydrogenase accessory sulfurtransferase FdhD n=1 Tax=Dokdonella sp. TaxID=2291710 RepID=UPI001B16F0BA|nr:formate dehydrogenase accessory sulfurtransferase FdhD [Dokdonella sp.]MBO9661889.1 formate dehydrogenase accessory sulfurtransferase FdhD [Dokdonella sp.]
MPPTPRPSSNGELPRGAVTRDVERHRDGGAVARVRDAIAEEIPIAFVYNERPHAVMMATPVDLDDFALGFSLSEGIVERSAQCLAVEAVEALAGIELRIAIPPEKAAVLEDRVRQLTGRTGCGLCGAQTLEAAVRHPPAVSGAPQVRATALQRALGEMPAKQLVSAATGAAHAAAWADLDGRIVWLREDVGRHNALDKLIGAMQRAGADPRAGFLLVTSRASYELVMKAATVGIGFLAAISAPTALAIALAQEAGVTLVAFARADGYGVYAHGKRLLAERTASPGDAPGRPDRERTA